VFGDILQPSHLLFILVIALIVLGPKKLPEVGRSLGKSMRDFRTALSGADPREDLAELGQSTAVSQQAVQPTPAPTATPAPEPAQQPEPASVGATPPGNEPPAGLA
jgi:sec-independent protein translocase protein TatA